MMSYELIKKQTNRITLYVTEDCTVRITAPSSMPQNMIEQYYKTHQAWLINKLIKCRERQNEIPKHTYLSGDKFSLLGEKVVLKVTLNSKNLTEYNANQKVLKIHYRSSAEHLIKNRVQGFYKTFANEYIVKRVNQLAPVIGVSPKKIMAKEQKKRWGTCNSKGNVYFNWRLIKMPPEVIDYVVIHELCHLVYLNHSKDFWQLVKRYCPEYKAHQSFLKTNGHKYFDI